MHDVIVDIAGVLASSLGLEEHSFRDWPCQFRINRYNYTQDTVGSSGVQIHLDSSFLTVLQEDECVGGLEVSDPATGEFVPVDPVAGSFLINIGDIGTVGSTPLGVPEVFDHPMPCISRCGATGGCTTSSTGCGASRRCRASPSPCSCSGPRTAA